MKHDFVVLYTSDGDGFCQQVVNIAKKKHPDWTIKDSREALLNDDFYEEVREKGIRKFPITVIMGRPVNCAAQTPAQTVEQIEKELGQ